MGNWLKRLRKEYIDDILIKEDYSTHWQLFVVKSIDILMMKP